MKTNDKKPAEKKENKAEKETKQTTEKVVVAETPQEKTIHPLDALIENIKADRVLLMIQDGKLTECKKEKADISGRLKDYKSDLKVFMKYATETQKQAVEELGLETSSNQSQTVNLVVESVLNIMRDKKKLTNEELFEAYVSAVPKGHTPETYTFFNIKIRSLFNRQVLKKAKGDDPSSSRTDIISLNETKTE